jgi:cytochrome c
MMRLSIIGLGAVVVALVTAAAVEIIREQREVRDKAIVLTGGIPDSGRDAIGHFGCGSCHTIPGITGAQGLVGPSLDRMANRVYIAGRLTNTPANLIRWLMDPQSVSPGTAMPQTGLGPDDARNISAYLYTLQ